MATQENNWMKIIISYSEIGTCIDGKEGMTLKKKSSRFIIIIDELFKSGYQISLLKRVTIA